MDKADAPLENRWLYDPETGRMMTNNERIAPIIQWMKTLTQEERLAAIGCIESNFCKHCGTDEMPCFCGPEWDDHEP